MAEERGLVVYQSRDGQEIRLSFDTVRKYLVSGKPEYVTDQEIMLYMGMCKARGLNPFKRDCYLIKYTERDPAATIVSIDYFRSRARSMTDCLGWKSGIMILKDDKTIEYREGSFILEGENLVGGWFKAKPEKWTEEYTWTVPLAPYVKTTAQGNVTQFWQKEKQSYMIAKVVESQGLRRLWPDEFQGLFIEEDIQPRDITPSPEIKRPLPLEVKTDEPARISSEASTTPTTPEPTVQQTGGENSGESGSPRQDQSDESHARVEPGTSGDSKVGTQASEAASNPKQTAPKKTPATLQQRVEWAKTASLEEISKSVNYATEGMGKQFSQGEQAAICRAVDARKQDLARQTPVQE